MEWDSGLNMAIALLIVLAIGPVVVRGHKEAHEECKRNMKEGWLKWLITHEFRIGSAKKS
jgi:hypothetical protein